jgi:hypothetical protein
LKPSTTHSDSLQSIGATTKCLWIAVIVCLFTALLGTSSISFAQNHKLVIQNGSTFNGTGSITIKDSVRNSNSAIPTTITGKVILSGAAQAIVANAANGSLQFDTLSLRGSGVKTIIGTTAIAESLNILSGITCNMNNDTLRIGNIIASAGTITTNANSVFEYNRTNSAVQSILGGVYNGKTRLLGNSRKTISSTLTIDSLEHFGWGLTINNNLTVNGKAQIDSLLNVAGGTTLSIGANNSSIATLQGNAGIIEANSSGTLTFTNNATNGSGTIQTNNSTINFNGNINSTGTLAVTGAGTMAFGGTVSSATYSFIIGSTQIYNGGLQTIVPTNYGNLTLSNAGTKTLAAGTAGIGGTISLLNGALIDATTNSATINYNGPGAQTIGALNYYNMTLSGARGNAAITFASSGTIRIAGTFTNSATLVTFVNTNSTIEYNGASAQTVTPFTYNNLTLSSSGAKTVSSSQTANGDVVQQAGTPLTVDAAVVWQIDGSFTTQTNLTNNGDITIGN